MTDILRGVAARVKLRGDTVSLTLTENHGVRIRRVKRSTPWRHMVSWRVRRVKKLNESKVKRIGRRKGTPNKRIAETAGISVRRVQKLWGRHRDKDRISYPLPMSRPGGAPPAAGGTAALSAVTGASPIGSTRSSGMEACPLLEGASDFQDPT